MTAVNRLRWGVLGTGSIASDFVSDLEHTVLGRAVAIGSRRQATAERFADTHGIPNRHASYQALVEDPDVDVVYIATPHPLHCPNAELALGAGKPVLVEKPFTMNAAASVGHSQLRPGEPPVCHGKRCGRALYRASSRSSAWWLPGPWARW